MAHDDFQTEPVRGLPETPPEGERIVWQGGPDWRRLARGWLRTRWVAAWFLGLGGWRAATMWADGATGTEMLAVSVWFVGLAVAAVGVLSLIAYATAKTTVYTITNRRVAMRIGVALTLTLNLPHRWIVSADLRLNPDGTGDIPLSLGGADRLGWLILWPHARPWRLKRPEPMLRAVPDAGRVAVLLADALRADIARREAAGDAIAPVETPNDRRVRGQVARGGMPAAVAAE